MELSVLLTVIFAFLATVFSIYTVIKFIKVLKKGTDYVFDYLLGIFIFSIITGFSIYGIIMLLLTHNII